MSVTLDASVTIDTWKVGNRWDYKSFSGISLLVPGLNGLNLAGCIVQCILWNGNVGNEFRRCWITVWSLESNRWLICYVSCSSLVLYGQFKIHYLNQWQPRSVTYPGGTTHFLNLLTILLPPPTTTFELRPHLPGDSDLGSEMYSNYSVHISGHAKIWSITSGCHLLMVYACTVVCNG